MPSASMIGFIPKSIRRALTAFRRDQRGVVAVVAATSFIPLSIAVGVAVDMSRLTSGRSALQRMVDSAALSGAAAYVVYNSTDSFNAVARNVAKGAFCNASSVLSGGLTLSTPSGGVSCGSGPGPAVSAVIGGYSSGTRGMVTGSGCSSTNTVVNGATCGFIVTVTATATVNTFMPVLMGRSNTLTVTASAVNPFINIAKALTPTLKGYAWNANSIWVYPMLLDANGVPDFSTNQGALPDTSLCTGDPTQTSCGTYTMLASTKYFGCTTAAPCTVNGTIFGGSGGVVQNPAAGAAVITATTPLGIAFASAAGGGTSYGYNTAASPQDYGCSWPATTAYNTVAQTYTAQGVAQVPWSYATHWFYSSYLLNNLPPSQGEINLQNNTARNPATGLAYNQQAIAAVPTGGVTSCPNNTVRGGNVEVLTTTFPATGNTNCSLYIVRDSTSATPNPAYINNNVCWSPTNTAGRTYAGLSCQSFGGHTFTFFWNDMGGWTDDTDYGNGTLKITCSGPTSVQLIN